MTIDEFEGFIRQSFLHHGLPVGRCSQILFSQLAHMPAYRGLNYPFQFVEREIMEMEGIGTGQTGTKPATPFRETGPLSGLMHKHFLVPGYEHLGVNAKLAWKLDDPASGKASQLISILAKRYQGIPFDAKVAQDFSRDLVQEIVYGPHGVQERLSRKATGDWIVYVPRDGKNYYLCIAKHDADDFIFDAVTRCACDFPFINEILTSAGG